MKKKKKKMAAVKPKLTAVQIQKKSEAFEREKIRKEIVNAYSYIVKNEKLFPTRADLMSRGFSRDKIRNHFGNMSGLREAAKVNSPSLFKGILDVDYYTSEAYISDLKTRVSQYKRFFITTAISGQWADKASMKSVRSFCKKNNALLLLLPSHDPAHNLDNEIEWHFDNDVVNNDFVFAEVALNSNITISDIRVTAKQINPTTGLGRVIQNKGSMIFASPKQSLEYIPVSNTKMPHAGMSTGAITKKNYKTSRGNSLRSAYFAEFDHQMGGIIVEIEDDNIYHFRQVQFDEDGSFADLGKLYNGNKTSKIIPDIVYGDLHATETDPGARQAFSELTKHVKAKRGFFHDFYSGVSINHHEEKNKVKRAKLFNSNRLNMVDEFSKCGEELNHWTNLLNEVVIVKSNHDEFLDRYISEGKHMYEPQNSQAGSKIFDAMVDGYDPLEFAMGYWGDINHPDKLIWLKRDQDFKVAGIECGAHGDKGPNGSRGSIKSIEKAFPKATIGHSHSAGILRGIFQVGTMSLLKLGYNIGPSSWIHCCCLVYPNGQRQLINAINGSWKL